MGPDERDPVDRPSRSERGEGLTPTNDRGRCVLVTGAAGFIGRHVVRTLERADVPVLAIDHAWRTRAELDSRVGSAEISACIHLGWYANPSDYLTSEPGNRLSLSSSLELLDLLTERDCRHLTVAGSSAEYRISSSPLSETNQLSDSTAYARSKRAFHLATAALERAGATSTAWCRIFNVSGPGEQKTRLLPLVTTSLIAGSPVALTDCSQVRDFLDVRDVAAALVSVSSAGLSGPINVCSGQPVTLRNLLLEIARRCGRPNLLRFGELARRPGDPDFVVGDARRISTELRWQRGISQETMLDDLVAEWQSRLEEGQ